MECSQKKSIQNLVIVLIVIITVNSCKENDTCADLGCQPGYECIDEECVYIVPKCNACGIYEGLISGTLTTALETDSTFTNLPVLINCSEGTIAYAYTVQIDISVLLGAAMGTLVPEVNAVLVDHQLLITNETYVYQGIASIDINGIIDFNINFEELNGTLTLTDAAMGTITFTAQRQ